MFDLLKGVRRRMLKWARQVLCAEESSLLRRVVVAELMEFGPNGKPGGLFMDAPRVDSVGELMEVAEDVGRWMRLGKKEWERVG